MLTQEKVDELTRLLRQSLFSNINLNDELGIPIYQLLKSMFLSDDSFLVLLELIEALNQVKADKDGSYASLTAGFAKEILPLETDLTEDLNASFIGRTTAENLTIPETGVTIINKIVGAWDDVKKECFHPTGGFLSIGGNWFRPAKVIIGCKVDNSGVIVEDGDYTVAIVPCVQGVSGAGKNNGFKVEFGDGYVDNTIGYVGYSVSENIKVGESVTLLEEVGGAYFPSGIGYMYVSVKSTVKLYIHPCWSGYMDGVYVSPSEEEIHFPMLTYGLSDIDWIERVSDSILRLHQLRKYLDLTTLLWNMEVIKGEESFTYKFTSDLPFDGKTNGTLKTNDVLGLILDGRVFTITSSTINSVDSLLELLSGKFVLYELKNAIVSEFEISSSLINSDYGGEFWIGTNVAPSDVDLAYGVSYVGYLRDDNKLLKIVNLVGAQSFVELESRVSSIEKKIKSGFSELTVENLIVKRKANIPS